MQCNVASCPKPANGNRGWCTAHYLRWYRHGDPEWVRPKRQRPTCSVEGCESEVRRNGLCSAHSMKEWRYGDPLRERPPQAERFWAMVNTDGPTPAHAPHLGQCWVWTGFIGHTGYGDFHLSGERDHEPAHRWAWKFEEGPIPDGFFVCHHCDTRACVRRDHLFLGTPADNSADMDAKGRRRVGRNTGPHPWRAKLTEDQVREVRLRRADGQSYNTISLEMKISVGVVAQIVTGKTWRHIP